MLQSFSVSEKECFLAHVRQHRYTCQQTLRQLEPVFHFPTMRIWEAIEENTRQAAWLMFEHTRITAYYIQPRMWAQGEFRFSLWHIRADREPTMVIARSMLLDQQADRLISSAQIVERLSLITSPRFENGILKAEVRGEGTFVLSAPIVHPLPSEAENIEPLIEIA